MKRRFYHSVSNVVDDAGNKGHATRLCCYGTWVFCGEVNWLRRESGRQLIPLGRRLGSYHGIDGRVWSWSSVLVVAATTGAVASATVCKISKQTISHLLKLADAGEQTCHVTYFLKNVKILKKYINTWENAQCYICYIKSRKYVSHSEIHSFILYFVIYSTRRIAYFCMVYYRLANTQVRGYCSIDINNCVV